VSLQPSRPPIPPAMAPSSFPAKLVPVTFAALPGWDADDHAAAFRAFRSGAAVLAILVQAGFIAGVMLNETKTSGYQTASAPTTAPDAGTFALIRFAPQASADDVTKFLETNKLSIASGPTAGGLYKVRVAVTGIPKAELARIVKKLQEDKVVGFIATTE